MTDRFTFDRLRILPSGYDTQSKVNTHGEILRRAILDNPDWDYYLIADADICFPNPSIPREMAAELSFRPDLFAHQAQWITPTGRRLKLDPEGHSEVRGTHHFRPAMPSRSMTWRPSPSRRPPRPLSFCILLKNSPILQRCVDTIGLSTVIVEQLSGARYYNVLGLLAAVMEAHGLRWETGTHGVVRFGGSSWSARRSVRRAEELKRLRAENGLS